MSSSLATLLQHPAIRRGNSFAQAALPVASSGHPMLDAVLPHGGWPLGEVSEVLVSQPGSGELALLLPMLAALTQQGRQVILIAPPCIPYAPRWQRAGVRLASLIWIAPDNERDILWSFEQVMREPACGATLAWFGRAQPDKSCRRLQLAAQTGKGLGILLRPHVHAETSTPFGLRLAVAPEPGGIQVRVLKRRGPPLVSPVHLPVDCPDHAVVGRIPPLPVAGSIRPGIITA